MSPGNPVPGPPRIVTAPQTGLHYDISKLSPTSRDNAQAGLFDADISMVRCYERRDTSTYHFELQERIEVVFPPSQGPVCSACPMDDGRACKHIWWVDDRVLANFVREQDGNASYQVGKTGAAVTKMGQTERTVPVHAMLSQPTGGFGHFAAREDWLVHDPKNPNDDMKIQHMVEEILSTFEPFDPVHHHDIFLRYKAALIGQAKAQPQFLIALETAVPANDRHLMHLGRIEDSLRDVFLNFDNYLRHGPAFGRDLNVTANSLRTEMHRLQDFVLNRRPSLMLRRRVADILIDVLQQVLNQPHDIYAMITWPRPAFTGGVSPRDKNLLTRLLHGVPPQQAFVYNVLKELGDDVLKTQDMAEQAERLCDQVRDQTALSAGLREGYANMLEGLVEEDSSDEELAEEDSSDEELVEDSSDEE